MPRLTRVTEILAPYYTWDNIPPGRLEHARERGTDVDRACMAVAQGCWAVCRPEVEPYVLSFKIWVKNGVEKIHAIQPELVDKDLGIVGHPDLVTTIKGNRYPNVTDLKTPISKQPLWRIQLAVYNHLVRKNMFPKLSNPGSLQLSPEGKTPKFNEYKEDLRDFAIFLSMLNVHRFLNS